MATANHVERARREGTLLGIPMGDLGWFQSVLLATATGFTAFFLATFVGILALLVATGTGHHAVDFSLAYRRIGLPAGLVVGAAAFVFLGLQWMRRMARRRA